MASEYNALQRHVLRMLTSPRLGHRDLHLQVHQHPIGHRLVHRVQVVQEEQYSTIGKCAYTSLH